MAESAVASVVRAFGTLAADEAAFLRGVHTQADFLRAELRRMQCFLRDADARRRAGGRDGARITNWVVDVRAAAYDAENALEEADHLARVGERGCGGILTWCADLAALHRFGVKIRGVRDRIREISVGAVAYGIADLGETSVSTDVQEHVVTPCDQDGDSDVGFHEERNSILQVLLDHDIVQICVVSVVGMPGSGKSTLAKKIYMDPLVKQHFHASSWISVSEKYRFLDLIKDIARRIMGITRKKMVRKKKDQDGEGTSSGNKMDVRELLREFRSGGRKKVTIEELDKMSQQDVRELLRKFCLDGRMEVTIEELDKMGEEDVRKLLRQFHSGGRMEVTLEELDMMGEEDVRKLLHEFLADRKFLLVLDDVWKSNSYSEINRILSALPDANNGSRIILTTRDMNVAKHVEKRSSIHEMKLLDERESWELLEKRSFPEYQNVSMADRSRLMPIGKKLAVKCKGLPLALVVLGGYLSRNLDYNSWSGLISNLDWENRKNDEPAVWNIIARSYNDLPNHQLKACFLYVASFPEDYVIRVARLCKLLIAEGIIPHRQNWTVEDTARKYIMELVERCMIQTVEMSKWHNSIKSVVLHDVLREWGIAEARREGLINIWSKPTDAEPFSDSIMAYRIALHNFVGLTEINVAMPKLRTLLVFFKLPAVSVLCRLKYLRVLDLYGLEYLNLLPSGIGNLIHLRFIGLQKCGNGLVCIPYSASYLLNLQTLDARGSEIRSLPRLFWNISTLRHLFLGRVKIWNPPEVGCLGSLQTLYFSDDCEFIPFRGALTSKQRRLIRSENKDIVCNNQKKWAAFISALEKMEQAVVLHLERWVDGKLGVLPPELISSISHHRHLQVLELAGKMMHGVNHLSNLPHGLKKLKMIGSKLTGDPMPVLGILPNLVVLVLEDALKWKSVICHAGGFPSLRHLTFDRITTVESWNVEAGAFPSLTHLNLISSFTEMPLPPLGLLHVTSLQTLLVKQSSWNQRPVSLENVGKLEEMGCAVIVR